MKSKGKIILLLLLITVVLLWQLVPIDSFLTFEKVKAHREELMLAVQEHYFAAVAVFILLYLSTALLIPGALVLTVTGGMLFGTIPAVIYVNIGATLGSVIAFLLTRFLIGGWVQDRFRDPLALLNRELDRHGYSYLLAVRILPVLPFFVVNYGAGITKIPLGTFIWATSLGMLPGSFVYAFTGRQLSTVNSAAELLSPKIGLALALLALMALLPVIVRHIRAWRERR